MQMKETVIQQDLEMSNEMKLKESIRRRIHKTFFLVKFVLRIVRGLTCTFVNPIKSVNVSKMQKVIGRYIYIYGHLICSKSIP